MQTRDGKTYSTKQVVLANGCDLGRSAEDWFGLHLPIVPVRGQIWVTESTEEMSLRAMVFGLESSMFFRSGLSRDDSVPPGIVCGRKAHIGQQCHRQKNQNPNYHTPASRHFYVLTDR